MTIVMTGAGSGGHITPILAIAHEIKSKDKSTKIIFIGQAGDPFVDIVKKNKDVDETHSISAGKFRRYHGGGAKQIFDFKTLGKNIKDFFRFIKGTFQAIKLLGKLNPDGVFIKGGYIAVPIGIAAVLRGIPYVTHDSDVLPGLANRIISRWAKVHAVALPKEYYKYPAEKTYTVGVPLSKEFKPITDAQKEQYKKEIGFDNCKQILFVIGGGLGAKKVNEYFLKILPKLLKTYPSLGIIHQAGGNNITQVNEQYEPYIAEFGKRLIVRDFITDVYRYSGAADVVLTRAGATNLAEFEAQAKACIVVPNPLLTGGHQLENAKILEKNKAAVVVTEPLIEKDPENLLNAIEDLFGSPEKREVLSANLHKFANLNATQELASLLTVTFKGSNK